MKNNYFDDAFYLTVVCHEGEEYTNDPDDAGGETKWGISKRSYPNEDIKNMTKERAYVIYKRDYWNSLKLGEVLDKRLAMHLFDIAVNHGVGTAGKFAQNCINSLNKKLPLVNGKPARPVLLVDGDIGQKTIIELNLVNPEDLNDLILSTRYAFIAGIVSKRPSQAKFIKSWIYRTNDYLTNKCMEVKINENI